MNQSPGYTGYATEWIPEFAEWTTAEKAAFNRYGTYPPRVPWNAAAGDPPPRRTRQEIQTLEGMTPTPTGTTPSTGVNPLAEKLLTREQLRSLPRPTWLVNETIPEASAVWIVGDPGSYKSFLAVDLACQVATGGRFLDAPVVAPRNVLYVAAESVETISDRVDWWETASRVTPTNLWVYPEPINLEANVVDLDRLIRACDFGLVIFDTQARVTVGMDENSAAETGKLISAVGQLTRSTRATVVFVHHSSKGGSAIRGSTAINGAADTVIRMERLEDRTTFQVKVTMPKQKAAAEVGERIYRLSLDSKVLVPDQY